MQGQIRDWQDEFDVEPPNHLHATIADETIDENEEDRRLEIAREGTTVVPYPARGFTIREWDFLTR